MKNINEVRSIDLHMHSTVSDGTDTPEEILAKMKESGIELFSITDHDDIRAGNALRDIRGEDDPLFLSGVEFSCKDIFGKYHILGYGYDADAKPICDLVEEAHSNRREKLSLRLEALQKSFGFNFAREDVDRLFALNNPGKPHIANLMVKYGYAGSKESAFSSYLNRAEIPNIHFLPERAIGVIRDSGGIPILAHPPFGSGDERIRGKALEYRLRRLMDLGILGVEAYYSGFSPEIQNEILGLAEKYDLYVTAGSDYHGKNKKVLPGENHLENALTALEGLRRFLRDVPLR